MMILIGFNFIFFNDIYIYDMSGTSDEIAFLEKMENEKRLHAQAQKNYRKRKSEKDPQYKTKLN